MTRHPLTLLARAATFALTVAVLAACGSQAQELVQAVDDFNHGRFGRLH